MNIEILARPAASAARVTLDAGETLTAEVGAMITMSTQLQVETTSKGRGGGGGILKGIRRAFSGENFFLNHFTSRSENQEIIVGPALMGDIVHHPHRGGTLMVQGSSWLASGAGIDIDTAWQGFGAALFSGEGIFWVKCTDISKARRHGSP